jgi:hypothetical protein
MAPPDEGSSVSARSGNDPSERAETYGPIRFRRHVKGDGRALILYTHGGGAPGGLAHVGDGSAHEGSERA